MSFSHQDITFIHALATRVGNRDRAERLKTDLTEILEFVGADFQEAIPSEPPDSTDSTKSTGSRSGISGQSSAPPTTQP